MITLENPRKNIKKVTIDTYNGSATLRVHWKNLGIESRGPYKNIRAAKMVYSREFQPKQFYPRPNWTEK